jgi:hypothetical protein
MPAFKQGSVQEIPNGATTLVTLGTRLTLGQQWATEFCRNYNTVAETNSTSTANCSSTLELKNDGFAINILTFFKERPK